VKVSGARLRFTIVKYGLPCGSAGLLEQGEHKLARGILIAQRQVVVVLMVVEICGAQDLMCARYITDYDVRALTYKSKLRSRARW
jgi:hypothetical protein